MGRSLGSFPGVFWQRDSTLAIGLTLFGLITRIIAIPASLCEWDDVLFAQALHRIDIPGHMPHPPGFPVFVVLGRAVYAAVGDEHLAYAAVALVFGALLPASLFYFYREVFQDPAVAVAGGLIGSVVPNVWVHGSASRSDGPALTLGVIGLTLVLRGLESRRALLVAGVLVGVATGLRITLLLVMAPALACALWLRLRGRQWRAVLGTLGLFVAGVLSWYVPLVLHTGWAAYRAALGERPIHDLY